VESHGGGQGYHADLLWNVGILGRTDTSSGRPKSLQVKEEKVLTEGIVSVLYRIMSLPRNDIGGGIGYLTTLSQSKGISSRLGRRELGKNKTLSSSEGEVLEILRTWHIRYRTRIRRGGSTKNCIGMTTSLYLSLSKRRVGSTKNCIDTTTSSTIG
jgi:hypothetical protein